MPRAPANGNRRRPRRRSNRSTAATLGLAPPAQSNAVALLQLRTPRDPIINMRRSLQSTTFASSTLADTHKAFSFALSDLPNASEFTSLFDMWRIVEVECLFLPSITEMTPGAPNVGLQMSVIDYDDATALSAPGSYLQYQNVMVHRLGEPIRRVFKPNPNLRLSDGTATGVTSGSAPRNTWVDVASSNTPYFGLKLFLGQNTVQVTYVAVFTYILQFRGVR